MRQPMQPRRGLQFLATAALSCAAILLPLGAAAITGEGAVLTPATEGAQASLSETLVDEAGPYATRTRGADGRWLLPSGDAVLIDEAWWTPLRPLGDRVVEPVQPDRATVRGVRATVAPAGSTRVPDRLDAIALGDVTADGQMDLVVSFRRPFRETLINRTRPRRFWVDGYGDSAHLGLYRPGDVHRIWVAGTLVAPVVELAACDGALAVAYGRHRRPGIVETGAWRWVVFGFLPTEPLPGTGTPVCVDIDGNGQSEPAIIGRSTR